MLFPLKRFLIFLNFTHLICSPVCSQIISGHYEGLLKLTRGESEKPTSSPGARPLQAGTGSLCKQVVVWDKIMVFFFKNRAVETVFDAFKLKVSLGVRGKGTL